MSWTLIASAQGTDSATLNSTGANVLIAVMIDGLPASPYFTDSRGNTWVTRTTAVTSFYRLTFLDCINPTSVGAGHTITDTNESIQDATIHFYAFSASGTVTFDKEGQTDDGTFSANTAACATLTPAANDALIMAGVLTHAGGGTTTSGYSVDSGLTLGLSSPSTTGGGASAYLNQTTAAAITPTFSWTTVTRWATSVAIYTNSAGGGGGDTTPPTLSSPTGTATGSTTATGTVATNEGNGTLYAVASTSGTAPTAAQVRAGQTHTGAAAPWSGNQAVTTTGTKTFNPTGLTASTSYFMHYHHRDAANNDSTVVSSTAFTTNAAGIAPSITTQPTNQSVVAPNTATFPGGVTGTPTPTVQWQRSTTGGSSWTNISGATSFPYTTPATTVLNNNDQYRFVATNTEGTATSNAAILTVTTSPGIITTPILSDNDGNVLANETGVIANVYNVTTGALVVRVTGLTSSATGVVEISHASISGGTTYAYEIVLTSNGRRLPSTVAS